LTDGGNSDRFAIEFLSVRSDDQFNLRVDGGVHSRSVEFTVAGPGTKTILFSDFGLLPSDFESVSLVELNITGTSPLASIQIDSIQTTGPVPPVTIGGTVTGLEGSGLVLQNNGADDEPIAADGEFTFDTLLTPGTSYSVTVKTQPSGQFCTVDKGSGTVPAEGVDDVLVTCGDLPLLDKIIGTWSTGIWYWDFAAAEWTKMTPSVTDGDIAAGDFTGDGIADVASIWGNGLWYQDGATLDWIKLSNTAPAQLTAGDVTGD
jgi:hypothetical protein